MSNDTKVVASETRPPVAEPWQLAGAQSQKASVAQKIEKTIARLKGSSEAGAVKPMTVAAFLREADVDRKTISREYHAHSYAAMIGFIASTGTSTNSRPHLKRKAKPTSYYKAMREFAAAATGARLEVRKLTQRLTEAQNEIRRLTAAASVNVGRRPSGRGGPSTRSADAAGSHHESSAV